MPRNVLITGGGSGLGKAMALRYAQEGAQLCIVDRDPIGAREVVELITTSGGNAFFLPCDITIQSEIDSLRDTLKAKWKTLDVLVNNAGVATAGGLESEDIEQWEWVLDINLLGMVRMTKGFVEMLKHSKSPQIINIASQAGITPVPMMGSYNVSKAAVVSFSETMNLELRHYNIHVSVACPSFFATNLDKSLRTKQEGADKLVTKMLNRSDISAEQVADIIVSQSDAGKFMILTHKAGRTAYRLKRYLPTMRYLNMIAKKTKNFGR
jgi:NAD(P)-dependent dehydrogenase (short-subunit alcohol dehydrogenase family)